MTCVLLQVAVLGCRLYIVDIPLLVFIHIGFLLLCSCFIFVVFLLSVYLSYLLSFSLLKRFVFKGANYSSMF